MPSFPTDRRQDRTRYNILDAVDALDQFTDNFYLVLAALDVLEASNTYTTEEISRVRFYVGLYRDSFPPLLERIKNLLNECR